MQVLHRATERLRRRRRDDLTSHSREVLRLLNVSLLKFETSDPNMCKPDGGTLETVALSDKKGTNTRLDYGLFNQPFENKLFDVVCLLRKSRADAWEKTYEAVKKMLNLRRLESKIEEIIKKKLGEEGSTAGGDSVDIYHKIDMLRHFDVKARVEKIFKAYKYAIKHKLSLKHNEDILIQKIEDLKLSESGRAPAFSYDGANYFLCSKDDTHKLFVHETDSNKQILFENDKIVYVNNDSCLKAEFEEGSIIINGTPKSVSTCDGTSTPTPPTISILPPSSASSAPRPKRPYLNEKELVLRIKLKPKWTPAKTHEQKILKAYLEREIAAILRVAPENKEWNKNEKKLSNTIAVLRRLEPQPRQLLQAFEVPPVDGFSLPDAKAWLHDKAPSIKAYYSNDDTVNKIKKLMEDSLLVDGEQLPFWFADRASDYYRLSWALFRHGTLLHQVAGSDVICKTINGKDNIYKIKNLRPSDVTYDGAKALLRGRCLKAHSALKFKFRDNTEVDLSTLVPCAVALGGGGGDGKRLAVDRLVSLVAGEGNKEPRLQFGAKLRAGAACPAQYHRLAMHQPRRPRGIRGHPLRHVPVPSGAQIQDFALERSLGPQVHVFRGRAPPALFPLHFVVLGESASPSAVAFPPGGDAAGARPLGGGQMIVPVAFQHHLEAVAEARRLLGDKEAAEAAEGPHRPVFLTRRPDGGLGTTDTPYLGWWDPRVLQAGAAARPAEADNPAARRLRKAWRSLQGRNEREEVYRLYGRLEAAKKAGRAVPDALERVVDAGDTLAAMFGAAPRATPAPHRLRAATVHPTFEDAARAALGDGRAAGLQVVLGGGANPPTTLGGFAVMNDSERRAALEAAVRAAGDRLAQVSEVCRDARHFARLHRGARALLEGVHRPTPPPPSPKKQNKDEQRFFVRFAPHHVEEVAKDGSALLLRRLASITFADPQGREVLVEAADGRVTVSVEGKPKGTGGKACARGPRPRRPVAQWKRAGPITQRSVDRNHADAILRSKILRVHPSNPPRSSSSSCKDPSKILLLQPSKILLLLLPQPSNILLLLQPSKILLLLLQPSKILLLLQPPRFSSSSCNPPTSSSSSSSNPLSSPSASSMKPVSKTKSSNISPLPPAKLFSARVSFVSSGAAC